MSEAAQIYALDHPDVPRKLRQRIDEEINKQLVNIVGATDWPDFRLRLGTIRGLQIAKSHCEELEKDM